MEPLKEEGIGMAGSCNKVLARLLDNVVLKAFVEVVLHDPNAYASVLDHVANPRDSFKRGMDHVF